MYNETVNAVIEDKQHVLWIATEKGIFQMQKDTIIRFGRKMGFPIERVNVLYADSKGFIWAGTELGLYRFQQTGATYSYKLFTKTKGLPGNIITSLKEDKHGQLWISTYSTGVATYYNDL